MKKIFASIVSFASCLVMLATFSQAFIPAHAHAAKPIFIGCNEEVVNDSKGNFVAFKDPCDFTFLIAQIDRFISFLLFDFAMPLAALIFAYAGWLYMSSGGSGGQVEKAKGLFKNVLIGFVLALAAWLIVKAIMLGLGFDESNFDVFYN